MRKESPSLHTPSRLETPSGPSRADQPWWNPQRASSMPIGRYARGEHQLSAGFEDRTWPTRSIDRAPLWASVDLRDGNQALAHPMDVRRKGQMFDLLVRMGFKDIEVGYPSASDADFSFVRELITGNRIPDDVTIGVFTPARPDLIDRTFEAIEGAERAMVHLCHATACLWREVVFGMSAEEVEAMAVRSAEQIARNADRMPGSRLRFEYSPETFNITEPDFALRLSNRIATLWDACPDRPMTLNLPTTVETDYPRVFADQIEWMHRNLERRDSIILSVHPHNDRGTAVATAEMALMAGADRVEGTLFGNGERTGNVCLPTLALNLFSQGIDPQLDFSDIDEIRGTVEACNLMPIGARHPYVGDLVYTAFSGTHQDAISKGLVELDRLAEAEQVPVVAIPWNVPYLPIDPKDVGRTYESVVRVNSQSGKAGISHVLKGAYGLDLPREMRVELAGQVQARADEHGTELTSAELWEIFTEAYMRSESPYLTLKEFQILPDGPGTRLDALVIRGDGRQEQFSGSGDTAVAVLAQELSRSGPAVEVTAVSHHSLEGGPAPRTAAYATLLIDGVVCHGAAVHLEEESARLHAVIAAANRVLR